MNPSTLSLQKLPLLANGLLPLDYDVTPFDNSQTKKEGVSRTDKGMDGYAPMAAYFGQEGYCKIPVLEGEELWSFVFRRRDKVWLWSALNRETREIVASACGERSENTCRIL